MTGEAPAAGGPRARGQTAAGERLEALRQALAPLVVEVATALLPWVERLDLAVGPMAAEDPQADGDPDGFHGLSRRGPYERLLLSEWLLATEVPDEFVRRATAGELAFLELSRRSEAGTRVTAVFFDAGPAQLGGPRLAHLALLLVMARRAQQAGATFYWGTLQQPAVLRTTITPDQAQQLLLGRSRQAVTSEMVQACEAHAELREARRELWLVGGDVARFAPGPSVEVSEPLSAQDSCLQVRLRRADRSSLEIELPLPAEDVRVRMMRDPFVRPAPAPTPRPAPRPGRPGTRLALDERRSLFFSDRGRRVFAGLEDGGLLAYPVPNSPFVNPQPEPTVVRPPPGHTLVAACWIKTNGRMVVLKEGRLIVHSFGKRGGLSHPEGEFDAGPLAGYDGPVVPLHFSRGGVGGKGHFFLVERDGIDVSLPTSGEPSFHHHVRQLASVGGSLLKVHHDEEGQLQVVRKHQGEDWSPVEVDLGRSHGRLLFGHAASHLMHPQLGLCAQQLDLPTNDWLVHAKQKLTFSCRSGEVVGVVHWMNSPELLVLEEGELTRLDHHERSHAVGFSTAPVVDAAVSTSSTTVALVNESRELILVAPSYTQQPVMKVTHV